MTIKSTKTIEELNAIIKETVIESWVTPLKEKGDKKSLFFGTVSKDKYKLHVIPENLWIKKPRTTIIIKIIDVNSNRLISIDYLKIDRLGLYMVALGIFLILVGIFTEFNKLIYLSIPLIIFGLFRSLLRLIGFFSGKNEADEKIKIFKEKITAANRVDGLTTDR